MKPLNHSFQNQTFSESAESLSRYRDPNLTQNEHVYEIWCRLEVAGDVISGDNVKAIKGYAMLNFEAVVVSEIFAQKHISSFRENQYQPLS